MGLVSPQRPPVQSESGTTSYTPRCTTNEYIKAIAHHSQQSSAETLYPGEIYDTLKRFLEQQSNTTPNTADHASSNLAWLISLSQSSQQASSDKQMLSYKHSLGDNNKKKERSEGFADPGSCIEALRKNIENLQPQILFLRGHPSPNWLSSIGAFCHVDPELFRWFLRYRGGPESDCYFDAAPSAMSNIFRFTISTIGSKHHRYRSSHGDVDALRRMAVDDLRRYHTDLRGKWALKPGDSIVRNFYVLDERHCVIEQEIVVSIFDVGRTWMAIACTDAGEDLAEGPRLPWLSTSSESLPITLLPIVQYRPRCALKSRSLNDSTTEPNRGKNVQSLAVFPEGYGRGLDWSLAKSDRYHALSDMFRLAAFSQKQLLNVLKEKIMNETSCFSLSNENSTLANLLYLRGILQDQLHNASYMLQLTDRQHKILQNSRRPIVTTSTDSKNLADHAMTEVYSLFQDLYSQAQSLHDECTRGMTVISHSSMLAESQRAIRQAKSVTKLTLVAFVYLPFTFTAGFFGMNFKELGTGTMTLWVYFSASLPLMLVTVAFFALDMATMKKVFRALCFADRDKP